jgi:hypothetical protein
VLRLAADRAERAAARWAPEEVAQAEQQAPPVVAELDRLAATPRPQARYPIVVCHLLLAQAEQSRVQGHSDPVRWQAAVDAWERLERPFEAAYARYRLAEAALRPADQTTVRLGAGPLWREIELLAQRGRLRLEEPKDGTTSRRRLLRLPRLA